MITTEGRTSTEYIRVMDKAAPGARGTFVFKGADANHMAHETLNSKGLAILSFPVVHAGSEAISVSLATAPIAKRTFHFALRPIASNAAATNGCTPK